MLNETLLVIFYKNLHLVVERRHYRFNINGIFSYGTIVVSMSAYHMDVQCSIPCQGGFYDTFVLFLAVNLDIDFN